MNLNGRLSFTCNVSGSMGAQLVANVEANPSGAPSQTLVSIRVGDVIYSIPSGGGGSGTSDYNALNNKPKVNNVTLSGDMTLADLGIQPAISFPGDGSKYLDGNGSFSTPAAGVSLDYVNIQNVRNTPLTPGESINFTPSQNGILNIRGYSSVSLAVAVDISNQYITTSLSMPSNAMGGGQIILNANMEYTIANPTMSGTYGSLYINFIPFN